MRVKIREIRQRQHRKAKRAQARRKARILEAQAKKKSTPASESSS